MTVARYAADEPDRRFALQAVGRRTQVVELGDWGPRPRGSAIVAIGRVMDGPELTELFDGCRAEGVRCARIRRPPCGCSLLG